MRAFLLIALVAAASAMSVPGPQGAMWQLLNKAIVSHNEVEMHLLPLGPPEAVMWRVTIEYDGLTGTSTASKMKEAQDGAAYKIVSRLPPDHRLEARKERIEELEAQLRLLKSLE